MAKSITKNSTESKLYKALNDSEIVEFVKINLKESYRSFFKNHEKKVEKMIDQALLLLQQSQKYVSSGKKFKEIVKTIDRSIFKKDKPYFWFNRKYQEYKKYIRPRKDYEKIKEFIKGKTILDFGCGGGYLALELQDDGYSVLTTDVLDYRIQLAKSIPFIKMTSPKIIPYPDNIADTAIVKTVLHHIDKKNIIPILKELNRTSKTLIIEEDTFHPPANLPEIPYLLQTQPLFKKFFSLTPEKQNLALVLVDFFANAVAFGKLNMNFPFEFKSVTEWTKLLNKCNFTIKKIIIKGFEKGKVHTNCQAWIIAEKNS